MKIFLSLVALLLASCASDELLQVRKFSLRNTEVNRDYFERHDENQFIRGEINMRVHGAVTQEEREARRGDYYTVSWNRLRGEDPVRVVFEYRQARSGSRVKKIEQKHPAAISGKTSFEVIGTDFQNHGRVTSWRMTLYEGSRKVAAENSYLWN